MGGLSIWHWLVVLLIVLVLFGGGGKISTVMGDFAKGLKSFKKNMAEDEPMDSGPERPAGSIAAPNAPHTATSAAATPPRETVERS